MIPNRSSSLKPIHLILILTIANWSSAFLKDSCVYFKEFTTILCSPLISPRGTIQDDKLVSSKTGECYVPEAISTKFSWNSCSNFDNCSALPAFTNVDNNDLLFTICKEGFSRELDNDMHVISCENGIWEPPSVLCRPIKYCQPLRSSSVKAKCQKYGKTVDCEKNVRAGTTAIFECKKGYGNIGKPAQDVEITCLATGKWNSSIPHCSYGCGIAPKWKIRSNDTTKASKFSHPWNAAVYQNSTNVLHICGGTLITPFTVISAGSCFHDSDGKLISASKFLVGLGKEHRELIHPDDTDTEQILNVKTIYQTSLYEANTLGYFSDVTILELSVPAVLSDAVMPACVDLADKYTLAPSTVGSIVGWEVLPGDIDGERYDDHLVQVDETYFSNEDCYEELKKSKNKRFVTKDKYCVFDKDKNRTSVRRGFSGAGFLSQFDGKYYLHGIISTRRQNHFNIITDIKYKYHLQFINDTIQEINESKKGH